MPHRLTTPELQALKTDITVTRAATVYLGQTILARYTASDADVLPYYNAPLVGATRIWRPDASMAAILDAMIGAEFTGGGAGQAGNRELWSIMTRANTLNAARPNVRTNMIGIFGEASVSYTNMLVEMSRIPTAFESLFTAAAVLPGTYLVSSFYGELLTVEDIAEVRAV
jgi:hypothetical protein